jgi:hypothetical protein
MQLAQQQLALAEPFGQDFQNHPIQNGASRGRGAYRGGGQVGRVAARCNMAIAKRRRAISGNDKPKRGPDPSAQVTMRVILEEVEVVGAVEVVARVLALRIAYVW